jgi:hypothetical protein
MLKAQKEIDNLTAFFALLGYARVKDACRMMMKLNEPLGINFINILLLPFLYKSAFAALL